MQKKRRLPTDLSRFSMRALSLSLSGRAGPPAARHGNKSAKTRPRRCKYASLIRQVLQLWRVTYIARGVASIGPILQKRHDSCRSLHMVAIS